MRSFGLCFLCVLVLSACLREQGIALQGGTLNPRFTLDRQPLSVSQQTHDPVSGPFRQAPGTVASYVYPLVEGADRLMQADCFWAAHNSGAGDDFLLNWESVIELHPRIDDEHRIALGDEDLAMCRFNDPVTRQPPIIEEGEYPEPDDDLVVIGAPSLDVLPLVLSDGNFPEVMEDFAMETGREVLGAQLVEIPSRRSNPDRSCDPLDQTAQERIIVTGVLGYDGGSNDRGLVATCSGPGRRIRPERDARYEVRHPGGSGNDVAQNFGVIMTAGNGERLLRPLAVLADGSRDWKTSTDSNRWAENFSPSLFVDAVRIVERVQGVDRYLSAEEFGSATLCIRPSGSADCRWRCPVQADGAGAGVFRPFAGACVNAAGDAAVAALTPTVDIEALETSTTLIDRPLAWRINLPSASTLLLEFRLSSRLAEFALSVDPIVAFGEVSPQGWKQRTIQLRNTGAGSVSVVDVYLASDSEHPQSFSFQVLSRPVSVPLGIELTIPREDEATLRPAEDFPALPAVTLEIDRDSGIVRGGGIDLDGQSFEVRGESLTFDGHVALTHRPDADFSRPAQDNVYHPMQLSARHRVNLPATLGPGEYLTLSITAQPDSTGRHSARLAVDYSHVSSSQSRDRVVTTLVATGQEGPQPAVIPDSVILVNNHDSQPRRYVVFANNGDLPYTINDVRLSGDDAHRFFVEQSPVGTVVVPGDFHRARIVYDAQCVASSPAAHSATMIVETDHDGFEVPVEGWSTVCP